MLTVFSPSVGVDPIWVPVRKMIEIEILDMRNPNHSQEQFFSDEPDFDAMSKILDQQFAIVELSRQKKRKAEPSILIIIDDFSAEPEMTRNNRLVNRLYTRGRHARISTITSVHRIKNVVNPIVRAQSTAMFLFRQKAMLELSAERGYTLLTNALSRGLGAALAGGAGGGRDDHGLVAGDCPPAEDRGNGRHHCPLSHLWRCRQARRRCLFHRRAVQPAHKAVGTFLAGTLGWV